jgi:hypothetical protein
MKKQMVVNGRNGESELLIEKQINERNINMNNTRTTEKDNINQLEKYKEFRNNLIPRIPSPSSSRGDLLENNCFSIDDIGVTSSKEEIENYCSNIDNLSEEYNQIYQNVQEYLKLLGQEEDQLEKEFNELKDIFQLSK